MTDQHRATPEQWAAQKAWAVDDEDSSCILELRDRVLALEAAQRPSPAPAPAASLVERVMIAGGMGLTDSARAAIREVAAWLRDAGDDFPDGVAMLLEQEASR
jgi:hypothetical protein